MDKLLIKLLNNEKFTESELHDLFWEYDDHVVDKWKDENRRWSCSNHKILKLDDRYFHLEADLGLTESQEDYFGSQPKEVYNSGVEIIERIIWKNKE